MLLSLLSNHIKVSKIFYLQIHSQCLPFTFFHTQTRTTQTTSDLLCDQLRAIDIHRLLPDKIASLAKKELLTIESQIQIVLGLG